MIREYRLRDFAVVFLGRGLGGMLNILFVMLAARVLGAELFGAFSLSLATMNIAMQFAGQGIDTVLVRLYIYHQQAGRGREAGVLRSTLRLRVLLTVTTVLVGVLLAELFLAYSGRTDLRVPLRFGFAGCAFGSLWYYLLAVLQAKERYGTYSLLTFGLHGSKILLLGAFLATGWTGLNELLGIQVATFVLGVLVSAFMIPRSDFRHGAPLPGGASHVFRMGKWIIGSSLLSVVYGRVDIAMLSTWRSMSETGLYSGAVSLIFAFDLMVITLLTVFLPNASKIRRYQDTVAYLKFSSGICGVLLLGLLGVYAGSDFLVRTALGAGYDETVGLFRIIFPGFLLHLFTFPWALVVYAYNRPHLLFFSDVAVLAFTLAGGFLTIPAYGMEAAAWVNLLARLLNSAIVIYLVVRESRKLRAGYDFFGENDRTGTG